MTIILIIKFGRRAKIRCLSCDKNLNDAESTRKSLITGEYLDLCNSCLSEIDIQYVEGFCPNYEDSFDEEDIE